MEFLLMAMIKDYPKSSTGNQLKSGMKRTTLYMITKTAVSHNVL